MFTIRYLKEIKQIEISKEALIAEKIFKQFQTKKKINLNNRQFFFLIFFFFNEALLFRISVTVEYWLFFDCNLVYCRHLLSLLN